MDTLLTVRKVCTDVMTSAEHGASLRQLVSKIRKSLKQHQLDLQIKTAKVPNLAFNEFFVNAYYDAEADSNAEQDIEVIVYHNINTTASFEHSQLGQFLVQIYDAVVHELRHRSQSRSRNYKLNPRICDTNIAKCYLSDPDEVDAYALSISIELIRNLGKTRSMQYLHRVSRLAKIRPKGLFASPALFQYFQIFDSTDPVIRKLIKKVYLNLQSLDSSSIFY